MYRNQTGSFLEEARKRQKGHATDKADTRKGESFASRYLPPVRPRQARA